MSEEQQNNIEEPVVEEQQAAGVSGVVFGIPASSPADARSMMTRCAEVMRSFR